MNQGKRNRVRFEDLDNMGYKKAWDYQTQLHLDLIDRKRKALPGDPEHHLLFVEHPPVYTMGKSGSMDNLLVNESQRSEKGIEFFNINRGGDITFHGPGQLVVYPIFDLDYFKTDVRWFIHSLEEAVILTMADYGIKGKRIEGLTGVWIDVEAGEKERKICAIGVHLSRWVSLHGLAFNINTDLDYFKMIIPCGIADKNKTVTSLAKEYGKSLELEEVKQKVKMNFEHLFELDYVSDK